MQKYIPIKNPITLDKFKDGSSPTRTENEMQELKNYQCGVGETFTREGITTFIFTPSVTASSWTPETGTYTDGNETAICAAVLNFDTTGNLGFNSVGSAVVNPLFSAMSTTNYSGCAVQSNVQFKQGTHSLLIERDTALVSAAAGTTSRFLGLSTVKGGTPDWFPGKSTTCRTFLATAWIYPTNISAGTGEENIIRFGNNTASVLFRAFGYNLQTFWQDQNAATTDNLLVGVMTQDEWQFVAAWCDFRYGNKGIYHYNDNTKVETMSANSVGTGRWFLPNLQRDAIGGGPNWDAGAGGFVLDASEAFHGYIDYMTFWTKIFSTNISSNITLLRDIRDLHATP